MPQPPAILGLATLAHHAFASETLPDLLARIRAAHALPGSPAALLDQSYAYALCFQPAQAAALQATALAATRLYRIPAPNPSVTTLRLLVLLAPGDLMANTPLEFLVNGRDIELLLLFADPDRGLPDSMRLSLPPHDGAFFAAGDANPAMLAHLALLFRAWPRPAFNNPAAIAGLTRATLAASLAGNLHCHAPAVRTAARDAITISHPTLIRPAGSHAGRDLALLDTPHALPTYLAATNAEHFTLTDYVDYRSADGLFRKYRVALIAGRPCLCHLAISRHWMVHYMNAEMATNAAHRAEEAAAFANFATTFAQTYAEAFTTLHRVLGLDYAQLDVAQSPDGRLLVFEADVAAIVHAMDPPDMYAYKHAPMQTLFGAFEAMLRG